MRCLRLAAVATLANAAGVPPVSVGIGPRARFRASGVLSSRPLAFMGGSGGSGGFEALQVEGLPVSPERVELRDFRALEAVAFAHL